MRNRIHTLQNEIRVLKQAQKQQQPYVPNGRGQYRDVVGYVQRKASNKMWSSMFGEPTEESFMALYREVLPWLQLTMRECIEGEEPVYERGRVADDLNRFGMGMMWLKSNCNYEMVEVMFEVSHGVAWEVKMVHSNSH